MANTLHIKSGKLALLVILLSGCNLIAGLDDLKVDNRTDAGSSDQEEGGADNPDDNDATASDDAETSDADSLDGSSPDADPTFLDADTSSNPDAGDAGPAACTGLICNGVCVPAHDPGHCGSCEHDCTSLPNVSGSVSCSAGQCVFSAAACAPGFAHCSSDPDQGCEVDLSQPGHCGSCTMVCGGGTPLCVGSAATQFACASGCNASAPTLCGQTCVDTAGSAAHCGNCDTPCSGVTGGQALCNNSQCDFTCNADRHRCGNTCAPNDSITQCGSGCVACPQPTGGTASCVSGSCTLSCGTGYVKSGNTCLSQYLYVSTTGNDANNGASLVTALRSFKRAMTVAVAGQTVRFAAGTYGAATGDDFSQQIPNGVNLERNGSSGTVTFLASGASLVFAGSANLSNLRIEGFAMPLGITTGTQMLSSVSFYNSTGPAIISGDARVTMQSGAIDGAPTATEMLLVQDTASLSWSSGLMQSRYADCSVTTSGIRVLGSAKITLTGFGLYGKWNSSSGTAPFYFDTDAAIDVSSGNFNNDCGGANVTMTVKTSTSATLNLFNCYFGGQLGIEPVAAVKVRQSSFHAAAGIYLTGSGHPVIDLGRAADLGGNSFGSTTSSAIAAFGSNNLVIDAAGNTWVPNQQGADANGRYTAGSTIASPATNSGRNFAIIGTGALVRF